MKKIVLLIASAVLASPALNAGSINIGIGVGYQNNHNGHGSHHKPHHYPNYNHHPQKYAKYNHKPHNSYYSHHRPSRYDYYGNRGFVYADNTFEHKLNTSKPIIGFYGVPNGKLHHSVVYANANQINWRNFPAYSLNEPPINHKWIKVDNNLVMVDLRDNRVVKAVEIY